MTARRLLNFIEELVGPEIVAGASGVDELASRRDALLLLGGEAG